MRYIASVVTFVFVVTSFGVQPNASAAVPMPDVSFSNQDRSDPNLGFSIPVSPEYGEIQEVYRGKSDKTIYYIQDAHNSVEAQHHTASLIQELVKKSGVRLVYEEGYEGRVPTDEYFSEIQDPAIKAKVSSYFLDQLRLGGAEYAHINRHNWMDDEPKAVEGKSLAVSGRIPDRDWRLIGVDSFRLHRETIEWYRKAARQKAAVAADLGTLFNLLQDLVRRKFPEVFQQWIKEKQAFEEGRLSFDIYLKGFFKKLQGIEGIKVAEEFPTISRVLKAGDDIARSETGPGKINIRNLLREIRTAENRLKEHWLAGSEERELFRLWETVRQARRLNEIEITSEEFGVFSGHFNQSITDEIAGFASRETRRTVILLKRWEKLIASVLKFYETALARESFLKEQLTRFVLSEKDYQAVLVYGGFHRAGIQKMLKELDISYVVLSPRITQTSGKHEELYRQLMQQGAEGMEAVPHAVATASRALTLLESPGGRSEIRLAYTILRENPRLSSEDLYLRMKASKAKHAGSQKKSEASSAQSLSNSRSEALEAQSNLKKGAAAPVRSKMHKAMKFYSIIGTIALVGATIPMVFLLRSFLEGNTFSAFLRSLLVSSVWISAISGYCVWMQDYLYEDTRVFFTKEFWSDIWDFTLPSIKMAVFFTTYYFLIEKIDLNGWFDAKSPWFKGAEVGAKMVPDLLLNYFVFYPLIIWVSFKDFYHHTKESFFQFRERLGVKKHLKHLFLFFFPLEFIAMGLNEFFGPGFSYLVILCGDILFNWKLLRIVEQIEADNPGIAVTTKKTEGSHLLANVILNFQRSEMRKSGFEGLAAETVARTKNVFASVKTPITGEMKFKLRPEMSRHDLFVVAGRVLAPLGDKVAKAASHYRGNVQIEGTDLDFGAMDYDLIRERGVKMGFRDIGKEVNQPILMMDYVIKNAIDAIWDRVLRTDAPVEGKIRWALEKREDSLVVEIEDNGIGFSGNLAGCWGP
jgi:hypothetical protein